MNSAIEIMRGMLKRKEQLRLKATYNSEYDKIHGNISYWTITDGKNKVVSKAHYINGLNAFYKVYGKVRFHNYARII